MCWVDSGPAGRCNKTVGACQPQCAADVKNVHGRNTIVRLYQEEVWEGT